MKSDLETAELEAENVRRDFIDQEEARTKELLAERSPLSETGSVEPTNINLDDIREVRNELK